MEVGEIDSLELEESEEPGEFKEEPKDLIGLIDPK